MDWVSSTAFLDADTALKALVYAGGASIEFSTGRGTLSLVVSDLSGEALIPAAMLHDLLTRAAEALEAATLEAVEAQRVPTPLNGAVAQAIVDGFAQGAAAPGPTLPEADTCVCPDQENHQPWCWNTRTAAGIARTEDDAR